MFFFFITEFTAKLHHAAYLIEEQGDKPGLEYLCTQKVCVVELHKIDVKGGEG